MYFVSEASLTANREMKPGTPTKLEAEHLKVEQRCKALDEAARRWECILRVQLQAPPDANSPYAFSVELAGTFKVADKWPKERDEHLVLTSAPAVLYGVAREYVRNLMAAGPYMAILLPTVNFTDAAPKPASRAPVPQPALPREPQLRPGPGLPRPNSK